MIIEADVVGPEFPSFEQRRASSPITMLYGSALRHSPHTNMLQSQAIVIGPWPDKRGMNERCGSSGLHGPTIAVQARVAAASA